MLQHIIQSVWNLAGQYRKSFEVILQCTEDVKEICKIMRAGRMKIEL